MAALINDWDINSRLMQSLDIAPVHKLSEKDFLRSQTIGRTLKKNRSAELPNAQHFLPQTYASASFLLALAPPSSIVALPKRLRDQEQLYPKDLTEKIPLDIDRYNAEKLFEAKPEIAFVSHYSHPATIQALSNQGVQLYMMGNLDTLSDIYNELANIGNTVGRPLEAELLSLFMKSALAAIDNELTLHARRLALQHESLPKVLFLYHHQNYSVPTLKGLTGHLLERIKDWDISLKFVASHDRPEAWSMPISKEQIANLGPDCLIIAAQAGHPLEKDIRNDQAFSQLSAVRDGHIYFVDEAIQQSPSQYIVLAYYDLVNVLGRLK